MAKSGRPFVTPGRSRADTQLRGIPITRPALARHNWSLQRDGDIDMNTQFTRIALGLLLGVAIAGSAGAQTGAVTPRPGEMGYLNGGIGKEQADMMREKSPQFPVRMTFSERNQGQDEFVADVHLRVTDTQGRTVLDLTSQGPIFLLRLPPGSYAVEAEHQGNVKTRRFDIATGRHENLVFSWS
jgi:hypothetical protein